MCVHEYMYAHACGSQKTLSSVITWAQFILFFERGSFTDPELSKLARLTGQ